MRRTDAIAALTSNETRLRAHGATALYLFGSTARDEARPESDLDLFIDYDPTRCFSLIDLVTLNQMLEQHLGVGVDLTTRGSLDPYLRPRIEQSATRVF
jgi:predicted nucleotidyltransferase